MVADTEMEADVEPSVETEERLEKEQFEAAQRLARLEAAEAEEARRAAAAAEAAALEAAQKQRLREVRLPPSVFLKSVLKDELANEVLVVPFNVMSATRAIVELHGFCSTPRGNIGKRMLMNLESRLCAEHSCIQHILFSYDIVTNDISRD